MKLYFVSLICHACKNLWAVSLTYQKNKTNLPVIIRVSTETAVLFGGEMKHEQIGTCKQVDNSELPLQSWCFEHEPPYGTVNDYQHNR